MSIYYLSCYSAFVNQSQCCFRAIKQCFLGEWKDNKHHGKGMMSFADGRNYIGDFFDGIRTGHGIYIFANSDAFELNYLYMIYQHARNART